MVDAGGVLRGATRGQTVSKELAELATNTLQRQVADEAVRGALGEVGKALRVDKLFGRFEFLVRIFQLDRVVPEQSKRVVNVCLA